MYQVHKQCKCLLLFHECMKFLLVLNNFQQILLLFWYLNTGVRLLSGVVGDLILSADNPLDFHN